MTQKQTHPWLRRFGVYEIMEKIEAIFQLIAVDGVKTALKTIMIKTAKQTARN